MELAQAGFVAPANVMHGHALAVKAMPLPMDKEIAEDIALLRAQQQIVNEAESKLATAYGNKPLSPRGAARMQAAQFQGVPEGRNAPTGQLMMPPSEDDPTGDPRPAAKPFVEGESPERGYEVARFASENGPRDLAEVDGDQVADWNDFFNNMNARVLGSALLSCLLTRPCHLDQIMSRKMLRRQLTSAVSAGGCAAMGQGEHGH